MVDSTGTEIRENISHVPGGQLEEWPDGQLEEWLGGQLEEWPVEQQGLSLLLQ